MNVINVTKKETDDMLGLPSIFLAGPCPRDNSADWRDDAIDMFKKLGFKGNIFNPTNREYNSLGPNAYTIQTNWEVSHMTSADVVMIWLPRDLEKNPAFTTNVEFGYWMGKDPYKVVYGRPDSAPNNKYLDWMYKYKTEKDFCNTLEDTVKESIRLSGSDTK